MTTKLAPLSERPAWRALEAHYQQIHETQMKRLFADDPARGERFTVEANGIFLDYSKNRVTDETLKLLIQLAEESGLRAHIDAMFSGEKINITENRAVLHIALRAPKGESIFVDGEDVVPAVAILCWTRWPPSPIAFAAAHGRGTPANGFATSSTSASGAPILGR